MCSVFYIYSRTTYGKNILASSLKPDKPCSWDFRNILPLHYKFLSLIFVDIILYPVLVRSWSFLTWSDHRSFSFGFFAVVSSLAGIQIKSLRVRIVKCQLPLPVVHCFRILLWDRIWLIQLSAPTTAPGLKCLSPTKPNCLIKQDLFTIQAPKTSLD